MKKIILILILTVNVASNSNTPQKVAENFINV